MLGLLAVCVARRLARHVPTEAGHEQGPDPDVLSAFHWAKQHTICTTAA